MFVVPDQISTKDALKDVIHEMKDMPFISKGIDVNSVCGIAESELLFISYDSQSGVILASNQDVFEKTASLMRLTKLLAIHGYTRIKALYWCTEGLINTLISERRISLTSDEQAANNVIKSHIHDLVLKAKEQRASDIHIDVDESEGRHCFRVDGRLTDPHTEVPGTLEAMARVMFVAMQRGGQRNGEWAPDAALDANIVSKDPHGPNNYILRYAQGPAGTGFHLVLRILEDGVITPDPNASFTELGYPQNIDEEMKLMLSRDSGLFLICGTTGAGKSKTVAKGLEWIRVNYPGYSIQTLENPIEIRVKGVNHKDINSVVLPEGVAKSERGTIVLGQMLRQDPDVIMVGEIRDKYIAHITESGIQSGHLVISTTHSKSPIDAVPRMKHYGIDEVNVFDPEFFAGIIYQALVRRVCSYCSISLSDRHEINLPKERYDLLVKVFKEVCPWLDTADFESMVRLHNPKGCSKCDYKGEYKRIAAVSVYDPQRYPDVHAQIAHDEIPTAKELLYMHGIRDFIQHNLARRERFEITVGLSVVDHIVCHMLNGIVSGDTLAGTKGEAVLHGFLRERKKARERLVMQNETDSPIHNEIIRLYQFREEGILSSEFHEFDTLFTED